MSVRPKIAEPNQGSHHIVMRHGFRGLGDLGDVVTTGIPNIPGTDIPWYGTAGGLQYSFVGSGKNMGDIAFIGPQGGLYLTYFSNVPASTGNVPTVADLNRYAVSISNRIGTAPVDFSGKGLIASPQQQMAQFIATSNSPTAGLIAGTQVPIAGQIPGSTIIYAVQGSNLILWDKAANKQYITDIKNAAGGNLSSLTTDKLNAYALSVQKQNLMETPKKNIHWGPIAIAATVALFTAGVATGAIGAAGAPAAAAASAAPAAAAANVPVAAAAGGTSLTNVAAGGAATTAGGAVVSKVLPSAASPANPVTAPSIPVTALPPGGFTTYATSAPDNLSVPGSAITDNITAPVTSDAVPLPSGGFQQVLTNTAASSILPAATAAATSPILPAAQTAAQVAPGLLQSTAPTVAQVLPGLVSAGGALAPAIIAASSGQPAPAPGQAAPEVSASPSWITPAAILGGMGVLLLMFKRK